MAPHSGQTRPSCGIGLGLAQCHICDILLVKVSHGAIYIQEQRAIETYEYQMVCFIRDSLCRLTPTKTETQTENLLYKLLASWLCHLEGHWRDESSIHGMERVGGRRQGTYPWPRVFQLQQCWHLGPVISVLLGTVLCILGYLTASLASTQYRAVILPLQL